MAVITGRALAGVEPLSNKTFNDVYRGDVLLDTGEIERGFLKDLDPRQLANELLVAVLGHAIGVSIPQVALALVPDDVSNSFHKLAHKGGNAKVAFFSYDAKAPTITQIIAGGQSLPPAIKASPGMGRMYGFDTWIANIDRHRGNILLSGSGAAYLIDHGHCFTGPAWKKEDLNSTQRYRNRLTEWLTPHLTSDEKSAAFSDVSRLIERMVSTDVHKAMSDALSINLYGPEDSDALLGFLESRVAEVSDMTKASLGILV